MAAVYPGGTDGSDETNRVGAGKADGADYRGENVGRISLIVDYRAACEGIKESLRKHPIRDEISIILISVGAGRILDEYVAPMIDGSIPEFRFTEDN